MPTENVYHVVDTAADLPEKNMTGTRAYLKDTHRFLIWDGKAWVDAVDTSQFITRAEAIALFEKKKPK